MKKSTKSTTPAAPQAKKTVTKKAVGTKKAATKKAAPVSAEPVAAAPAAAPKKVAAKKTAVKRAAPVKPAPAKKVVTKKAPAKKAAAATKVEVADTVVTAKINIGFGNTMHLRGSGPGLSWDGGVPMNCAGDDEWTITLSGATAPIVFKFLVNDLTWSVGDDFVVEPGSTVVLEPSF
ncbi:hypothetical protein [Actomonas aquatica]|uniref:CBM20 domain-containing protein n=1 Tax=Actomonas aquatica TaxID=2866162 RepID=A0ABZ1C5W0_9BACT|nr:hypothetical protein [Opitutus sp. WL0086]WRQ87118.1 hypothetical protein K1X11_020070 [Opitutus sp. WL0086]